MVIGLQRLDVFNEVRQIRVRQLSVSGDLFGRVVTGQYVSQGSRPPVVQIRSAGVDVAEGGWIVPFVNVIRLAQAHVVDAAVGEERRGVAVGAAGLLALEHLLAALCRRGETAVGEPVRVGRGRDGSQVGGR